MIRWEDCLSYGLVLLALAILLGGALLPWWLTRGDDGEDAESDEEGEG